MCIRDRYLNNNARTYSNPLMVDMGNTQAATENIYKGQVIIDAGATNSLNADSYYIAFQKLDGNMNVSGYDLQEAVFDSPSGYWNPAPGTTPQPLTSTGTVDSNFFTYGTHHTYYNHYVSVPSDLNDSFINTTASNTNITDIKTTFTRNDAGQLTITETLDPIDTLSLIHISEPTRPY